MCSVSTSGGRNSAKGGGGGWRVAVTLCEAAGIALRHFFNIRTTLRQHLLGTGLFISHKLPKAAIL